MREKSCKEEDIKEEILSYFLPEGTLEYFECKRVTRDKKEIRIVLEEKNNPPAVSSELRGRNIQSKGLWNISVNDFPIRGRKVTLLFRRRTWRVEGEKKLLKRDIPLTAPGTQLEQEFANFLKE